MELAEKSSEEVEERGRGEGHESVDHWRRRRTEQGNHILQVSGREVLGMQQERTYFGDECGNVGSGLENEKQAAGSAGGGEKKQVRCEVLARQTESGFSKELFEDGFGSRESMERTSRGASRPQKG